MKPFFSTLFILCTTILQGISQSISNEQAEIYLVYSMDSTQKIHLKNGSELYYELDFVDTLIESQSTYLQGTIESISDTAINYKTWSETSNLSYLNGNESEIYNTFESDNLRTIPINQLEYLQYSSPTRTFFNSLGGAIAGFSSLTTLLVAPLVSINYKNGSFNKKRYFAVAGSGLIGLAVSIPITSLSKPKKYQLIEKSADPEEDYWYLEQTHY